MTRWSGHRTSSPSATTPGPKRASLRPLASEAQNVRFWGQSGHGANILHQRTARAVASDPRSIPVECQTDRKYLLRRHALIGQFLFCFFVLGQMRQSHATQHIGRFSELNIVVANDFHSVTPGVQKIKERTIKQGNTSCLQCLAGSLLVVHDEAEVTTIVCGLPATFLQGNKLIAKVDEGHGLSLATQLESEESAVERQRLVDVADLQRNMVEANDARFRGLSH